MALPVIIAPTSKMVVQAALTKVLPAITEIAVKALIKRSLTNKDLKGAGDAEINLLSAKMDIHNSILADILTALSNSEGLSNLTIVINNGGSEELFRFTSTVEEGSAGTGSE